MIDSFNENLWGSYYYYLILWAKSHGVFFYFFNFYLFIYYFWLCWVFVSVRGLSLVAASGGHSSSRCAGLSLSRPLSLGSTGSRHAGSVAVAHGPSCSAACGIFPDQGSNPCHLHRQSDSQPPRHQGSPSWSVFEVIWLKAAKLRSEPRYFGHMFTCCAIYGIRFFTWSDSLR